MSPNAIVILVMISIFFTITILIPVLSRILQSYSQSYNPSPEDENCDKIIKLFENLDKWLIIDDETVIFTTTKLKLRANQTDISCIYPILLHFNKNNTRRLWNCIIKLKKHANNSSTQFLNKFLNDEVCLSFSIGRTDDTTQSEISLWLKTDIVGYSFFDVKYNKIWFAKQEDLIACKLRWDKKNDN